MKINIESRLVQDAINYIARGFNEGAYTGTAGGNTVAQRLIDKLNKVIDEGGKQ